MSSDHQVRGTGRADHRVVWSPVVEGWTGGQGEELSSVWRLLVLRPSVSAESQRVRERVQIGEVSEAPCPMVHIW